MTTALITLSANADKAAPAVITGQGLPPDRNGLKCHYYWRQAIADGEYADEDRGVRVVVTAARRKAWETNFHRMREAGEEPPVTEDHEEKSRGTLGYVVGVRQNGKWLEELHQYLGDEARDIALKNKISVGIHPRYKTGNGVFIGDAIVHSGTTPRPVVPGQGEAVIAASRGPADGTILLSLAAPTPQESDMDLTALRKAIGAADTVPDADVISQAATKLATIPTLTTERDTARTELSRRPAADEFPAAIARGSVNVLHRQVELMAREGSITAEQATAARDLIGTADKPNLLALSRTGADHPAEKWLEVLALRKAGAKADGQSLTGEQVVELSRQASIDPTGATKDPDTAKVQADATAAAQKWQADQLRARGFATA
jgi:hypothetical protein